VRVGLVSIASNEQPKPLRHPAKRGIFWSILRKGSARGEFGDADPARIGGEQVFGQHRQFDRVPGELLDEDLGAANLAFDFGNMSEDLRAGGGIIGAALDRARGQLHRDGTVDFAQRPRLPGFIRPLGST
jgi:hypothetical protein